MYLIFAPGGLTSGEKYKHGHEQHSPFMYTFAVISQHFLNRPYFLWASLLAHSCNSQGHGPRPLTIKLRFLSFLDVSGPLLALFGVLYEAPFSFYIMNQKRRRFQDHQRHQIIPFERITAPLPVPFGRLGPFIYV